MVFKKLHLGSVSFSKDTLDEIQSHLEASYSEDTSKRARATSSANSGTQKIRRTITSKVKDAIKALALCHNVTPVLEHDKVVYQASSPDEVALVKFSESVNLTLAFRDITAMKLRNPLGEIEVSIF
jgi:phospholipid-translocating ATPase